MSLGVEPFQKFSVATQPLIKSTEQPVMPVAQQFQPELQQPLQEPAAETGMSTRTKVLIGAGIVALAAGGIYIATRGRSGSKGAGNAVKQGQEALGHAAEEVGNAGKKSKQAAEELLNGSKSIPDKQPPISTQGVNEAAEAAASKAIPVNVSGLIESSKGRLIAKINDAGSVEANLANWQKQFSGESAYKLKPHQYAPDDLPECYVMTRSHYDDYRGFILEKGALYTANQNVHKMLIPNEQVFSVFGSGMLHVGESVDGKKIVQFAIPTNRRDTMGTDLRDIITLISPTDKLTLPQRDIIRVFLHEEGKFFERGLETPLSRFVADAMQKAEQGEAPSLTMSYDALMSGISTWAKRCPDSQSDIFDFLATLRPDNPRMIFRGKPGTYAEKVVLENKGIAFATKSLPAYDSITQKLLDSCEIKPQGIDELREAVAKLQPSAIAEDNTTGMVSMFSNDGDYLVTAQKRRVHRDVVTHVSPMPNSEALVVELQYLANTPESYRGVLAHWDSYTKNPSSLRQASLRYLSKYLEKIGKIDELEKIVSRDVEHLAKLANKNNGLDYLNHMFEKLSGGKYIGVEVPVQFSEKFKTSIINLLNELKSKPDANIDFCDAAIKQMQGYLKMQ